MLPIRHLVYGEALSLEVEGKHKEMTELLEVKEVQMFIDVGEAVNGFVGHAELSTLYLYSLDWNVLGDRVLPAMQKVHPNVVPR